MDSSSTLNSLATNALTLNWSFGFNKDVVDGVHSLCSDGRQALFFVAAHTGVIYDYAKRTQDLLQVCSLQSLKLLIIHAGLCAVHLGSRALEYRVVSCGACFTSFRRRKGDSLLPYL